MPAMGLTYGDSIEMRVANYKAIADARMCFRHDVQERWCTFYVRRPDPMNGNIDIVEMIVRIDQPFTAINFHAVSELHHADLADACHVGIGRFDIDRDEISHRFR